MAGPGTVTSAVLSVSPRPTGPAPPGHWSPGNWGCEEQSGRPLLPGMLVSQPPGRDEIMSASPGSLALYSQYACVCVCLRV